MELNFSENYGKCESKLLNIRKTLNLGNYL